jgi:hypothetical protein
MLTDVLLLVEDVQLLCKQHIAKQNQRVISHLQTIILVYSAFLVFLSFLGDATAAACLESDFGVPCQ